MKPVYSRLETRRLGESRSDRRGASKQSEYGQSCGVYLSDEDRHWRDDLHRGQSNRCARNLGYNMCRRAKRTVGVGKISGGVRVCDLERPANENQGDAEQAEEKTPVLRRSHLWQREDHLSLNIAQMPARRRNSGLAAANPFDRAEFRESDSRPEFQPAKWLPRGARIEQETNQ